MARPQQDDDRPRTARRPEHAPLSEDIGPVRGAVKRVTPDKGFGFILLDDGKTEIFFHMTALSDDAPFEGIRSGQAVSVIYHRSAKGLRASRVDLAV